MLKHLKSRCRILAAICLPLLMLAEPGFASDEEAPDYAQATLIGDPGGRRIAAWQAGWAIDAGLKFDAIHTRGGLGHGSRAMSNIDLRIRADLSKIAGRDGATAYLHILDNRGDGINSRFTRSLLGVSNIEVPVPTTRIFHAWLQQDFFDEQFSLLAGLYPIDSEFFVMESASLLVQPPYGPPADFALTRGPSVFNNSAFGLRARWQSADRTHYALAALLDGVPNDPDHPRRTAIRFAAGDGSFAIAEMGWLPLEQGHVFEPVDPADSLRGPGVLSHEKYGGVSKYAFGLWRYSKRMPDLIAVDATGAPELRRSQGAYILAERTLFGLGEAGRDVSAFARYSVADGDSLALDRVWSFGVRLRGLLAARPNDTLLVAWTQARLSDKYRALMAKEGVATAAHEASLEITWRAQLTPYFAVQPVAQIFHHPGGERHVTRATILGLRFESTF